MFMMSRFLLGTMALGAGVILQCGDSGVPNGPSTYSPGAGYVPVMSMSYTVSGVNQITTIQTRNQCNDSVLARVSDTTIGVYSVTAESLYVIDTSGGSADTAVKLQRVGGGTGIIGTWREIDSSGGTNTEALYAISATAIQGWVKHTDLISAMKSSFAAMDSSGTTFSGITLDTSFADRILFSGNTSHEVVTLTIADNAAFRWSSTNPLHTTQDISMFGGPTKCPANGMEAIPTWFVEFATANTTLPKLRAVPRLHFNPRFFGR
jgi:hypothetical protein